jgi:hypothetical protein
VSDRSINGSMGVTDNNPHYSGDSAYEDDSNVDTKELERRLERVKD